MQEHPPWDEGVSIPHFEPLKEPLAVDVAIIGGGLTGITAAYLLSQENLEVAVIEKDRIGWGVTGATTAFLTHCIDTEAEKLITIFGEKKAKDILYSHKDAVDRVERIVQQEHIDCEFVRCSNYIYASEAGGVDILTREQEAFTRFGLAASVKKDTALPWDQAGYLEVPHQAKFHPLKYLSALTRLVSERGVKIFEKTEVKEMQPGEPVLLKTADGEIRAKHVFVATYTPFDKKLFFRKAVYHSYAYELEVPVNTLPEGIYEDLAQPYHYFRIDRLQNRDRIVVGGEDHRADVPVHPTKNFQALEDFIKETFSDFSYKLLRRWHGDIAEPVDGIALIGSPDNNEVMYATGFSGNGMTYSMIAATIFADFARGKQHPWLDIYDAGRRLGFKALSYKGFDYAEKFFGGAVRNTFKYRAQKTDEGNQA